MNPIDAESYVSLVDEELARLCGARPVNEEACRILYQRFYDYAWRQAYVLLKSESKNTDDVVQKAFVKLFRHLPNYTPQRAKVKTYLSMIIRTGVIDHFRSVKRGPSMCIELSAAREIAAEDGSALERITEMLVGNFPDQSTKNVVRELLRGGAPQEIGCEYSLSPDAMDKIRTDLRVLLTEMRTKSSKGSAKQNV